MSCVLRPTVLFFHSFAVLSDDSRCFRLSCTHYKAEILRIPIIQVTILDLVLGWVGWVDCVVLGVGGLFGLVGVRVAGVGLLSTIFH